MEEPIIGTLAETQDFSIWQAEEPDGETTYHVELGIATLHFFREEWEELVELIAEERGEEEVYDLELEMVTVHFPQAKWEKFKTLIEEAREHASEER